MTQNLSNDTSIAAVAPIKQVSPVNRESRDREFSHVIAGEKKTLESKSVEEKGGNSKPSGGNVSPKQNDGVDSEVSDEEGLVQNEELDGVLLFGDLGIADKAIQINSKVGDSDLMQMGSRQLADIKVLAENALLFKGQLQALNKADSLGKGEMNAAALSATQVSDLNLNTLQKTELSIPQKVGSADWGEALAGRLSMLVNQKISSAKIQLTPPELGPIEVRVNLNNEQASVQFISHSAQVRDALEQTIPRLREMLESSGFSLADSHVGQESNQGSGQKNESQSGNSLEAENTLQNIDPLDIAEVSIGLIDDYV